MTHTTDRTIPAALHAISADHRALVALPFTALAALALFVLVPVYATPGNTVQFQLSITRPVDWILIATLALLAAANVVVEVAARRRQRRGAAGALGRTAVSSASGLFGVLIGTAACTSCLASILGFVGIGFGSTLFVLQHRTPFLIGVIALSAGVLALAMRHFSRACASCYTV